MKVSTTFLIILIIAIILYGFSGKPYINGNSGICKWPLCSQRTVNYEGYINGISDANNEAGVTKQYTENIPQGTYFVSFSYDDGVLMPSKPHFKFISFILNNLDDVKYLINGKEVDKSVFLPKSLGSKVRVKAIEEVSNKFDIEGGERTNYKLLDMDLIQDMFDIGKACVNCQTFNNDFVSFKYSSDWKVVRDGGPFITLRRSKYFKDEDPKWCTYSNKGECDCFDINKKCAYDIQLDLTKRSRAEYGNALPLSKTHKVFSSYNSSVFSYADNGLDGPRFFAEGKLKNIYMTANMGGLFGLGDPFPMENNSLMPYLILATLNFK